MVEENSIFLSTQELQELIDSGSCQAIDSTIIPGASALEAHFETRIKSAKFFNILEIKDKTSSHTCAMPSKSDFTEFMKQLGLPNDGRLVVVYDQQGVITSPRGWFMLKYFGYPQVRILDGGLPKWVSESRPTESGTYPHMQNASVEPNLYQFSEHSEIRALFEDIKTLVEKKTEGDNSVQFWDPRPPSVFESGSIPYAHNFPAKDCFNEDKTIKPKQEVERLMRENGIDLDKTVITSCLKGNTSSLGYMLLKYVGKQEAKNYTGSYEEWVMFTQKAFNEA